MHLLAARLLQIAQLSNSFQHLSTKFPNEIVCFIHCQFVGRLSIAQVRKLTYHCLIGSSSLFKADIRIVFDPCVPGHAVFCLFASFKVSYCSLFNLSIEPRHLVLELFGPSTDLVELCVLILNQLFEWSDTILMSVVV